MQESDEPRQEVGRETLRILRQAPDEAVARLRHRIRDGKADYRTWHNLGVALHNNGLLDEALAAVRSALDLNPESVETHFLHGTLLREADLFEEALRAFDQVAELSPGLRRLHANQGVLHFFMGNSSAAIRELEAAIEVDPDDLGSLFNLAVIYVSRKRFAEAQQIFERLIDLEPDRRSYYHQFLVELGRVQVIEDTLTQAHRIKNFLGIIGDRLRRFCEGGLDPLEPEAREDLQAIRDDHEQVYSDLVVLLGAIRPRPIRLEPVDLRRLIDRIVFVAFDGGQGTELERVFDEDLPRVSCDIDMVQEVFLNLLLNALDAVRAGEGTGGRVRISVRKDPEGVEVSFEDNGIGIPAGDLDRVFQFGFTTKSLGTGIGLAHARKVIEDHGGRITVESSEGKGSRFTCTLLVPARISENLINLAIRSQLLVAPRDLILEEGGEDLGI